MTKKKNNTQNVSQSVVSVDDAREVEFDERRASMVLVHAPWCHFCVMLRPEWDKAVQAALPAGVQVIEIEMGVCREVNEKLRTKLEAANDMTPIRSVPCIFVSGPDGKMISYEKNIAGGDYDLSPDEAPRSGLHILRFLKDTAVQTTKTGAKSGKDEPTKRR